jgi:hypothetical protein
MEAVGFSETSVNFCQIIWLHIPEGYSLHSHHNENHKSKIFFTCEHVFEASHVLNRSYHLYQQSLQTTIHLYSS